MSFDLVRGYNKNSPVDAADSHEEFILKQPENPVRSYMQGNQDLRSGAYSLYATHRKLAGVTRLITLLSSH